MKLCIICIAMKIYAWLSKAWWFKHCHLKTLWYVAKYVDGITEYKLTQKDQLEIKSLHKYKWF